MDAARASLYQTTQRRKGKLIIDHQNCKIFWAELRPYYRIIVIPQDIYVWYVLLVQLKYSILLYVISFYYSYVLIPIIPVSSLLGP